MHSFPHFYLPTEHTKSYLLPQGSTNCRSNQTRRSVAETRTQACSAPLFPAVSRRMNTTKLKVERKDVQVTGPQSSMMAIAPRVWERWCQRAVKVATPRSRAGAVVGMGSTERSTHTLAFSLLIHRHAGLCVAFAPLHFHTHKLRRRKGGGSE